MSTTVTKREVVLSRATEVYGLAAFLVVLCGIAGAVSPGFLTAGNIGDILTQAAPLCVAVLGQSFVIIVRGLDLSVGSVMATIAVIATSFEATSNEMIPAIVLSCVLAAALVGLINGLLVTRRGVSPFLATLAMMTVLQGLRFAYTGGAPSGRLPDGFRWLGSGHAFHIPANALLMGIVALLLGVLLHRTVFGRKIMIVGGNPRAADLVGIRADRITLACYVLCAMMSGVAGLLLVGYVGTVDNWVGRGYELDSIVGAVIGGVALTGGSGTIPGALLGGLILVVLFNIVVILGLPTEAQLAIKGVVIVFAAAIQQRNSSLKKA